MTRPRGYGNATLDNLWRYKVYELADYKCEICGQPAKEAHHIERKKNHSTRWWIPNGINLCNDCHQYGPRAAHRNNIAFTADLIKLRGQAWVDELAKRAGLIFKWQKHLEEIKDYLQGNREDYL